MLERGHAGAVSSMLAVVEPSAHRAQIIHRIVSMARERLGLEVSFVSEFEQGRRMFRFVDGDAGSFDIAVDEGDPLETTYCHHIVEGTVPSLLPDTDADPVARALAVTEDKGMRAYLGVPIVFSDGRVYGTFCAASHRAEPDLSERDVDFLRVAAALVAEQLERDVSDEVSRHEAREQTLSAIDGEEVMIAYQPVVELGSGRIVSVEALSRFGRPPPRPPDVWFAQAWEVGFGPALELSTARLALDDLHRLPPDVTLSLNFSPDTLLTDAALELLDPVPGERLVVEVTEHAPVHDYAPLRDRIERLRARGVRLALDDMGTGYAGLSALVELRPEVHKIDRTIVRDVRRDRSRRALIAGWVSYAAVMGATVIAEGIETTEELETLEILGLRHGQGFHLARPAAMAQLPF